MSVPTPTTIATGFADAAGCAYRRSQDQLLVADNGNGTIASVLVHTHAHSVLGTGYHNPHDIVLSADGIHAYVLEAGGTGDLLHVDLGTPNRASATVIATGLSQPDQLVVDEAHGYAYVTEFKSAGHLLRINLGSGAQTTMASGLVTPRGLLMTSDARFFYVSEDTGRIRRFDVTNGSDVVIASGLNGPRHMTWADAGQSVILVPVPNPTPGNVMKVDLTVTPAVVSEIATGTPSSPYSLAVLSPEKLLICSGSAISQVDLTDSIYSPAGPILLGVGHVPADRIFGGYADTTGDPTYFFQVKDAPFGGTLPLMINHEHARGTGAAFYKVLVSNSGQPEVESHQSYGDYRWSVALNEFELITVTPVNGFYPVHGAGEIWYNFWLGLLFDTLGQQNNLNTIRVKLFANQNPASEIGHETDAGRSVQVMLDNTGPTAQINQILHDGSPVGTCAIVNSGSHLFTFAVTAEAARHLQAWSLTALWGDNQSKAVASDNYSHHATPTRLWTGLHTTVVPLPGPTPWDSHVVGDPTSTHCAHTFELAAWDRVINGFGPIHGAATYFKSITIMVP